MFESEDIDKIAKHLNYPYSYQEELEKILVDRGDKYGQDWVDKVKDKLTKLDDLELAIEQEKVQGSIKRTEVDEEYKIEYFDGQSKLNGLQSNYNSCGSELQRLLGIAINYPQARLYRS